MMDQQRKRELKREARQAERASLRADMPINVTAAEGLLDWLDGAVSKQGCSHDLRHSRAWAEAGNAPTERLLGWLIELGGFCDCEALSVLEDSLEEIRKC
jgi:hypothetical protein